MITLPAVEVPVGDEATENYQLTLGFLLALHSFKAHFSSFFWFYTLKTNGLSPEAAAFSKTALINQLKAN